MKRNITFLMASIMAASCFSVTGYAANFSDINNVPWDGAKTYINSVADKGLMVGDIDPNNGKTRFRGKERVTYCETTQLAYTVLKKANKLKGSTSDLVSKWTHVMKSYNIPTWAYEAVAYALENNVISLTDVSRFVNKKGNVVNDNYASRESVAVIFGKMLSGLYTVNNSANLAFGDKASIAKSSVPYVDLLARLGILVGDTDNNFTPKAYINRAEMAVLTAKTYDVVGGGTNTTTPTVPSVPQTSTQTLKGTIAALDQYGGNQLLSIRGEDGQRQGFMITNTTYVLQGNTTTQLNVSYLNVGDSVSLEYTGGQVKVIRVLSDIQSNREVVGDLEDITNTKVYIIHKDGKSESYFLADRCDFKIDKKTVSMKDIFDSFEEHNLEVTLKLNSVGYVTEFIAEEGKESGYTGTLVSIDDDEINVRTGSRGKVEHYDWADRPNITLEGKSATIRKVREKFDDKNRLYVKFYLDHDDEVKKLLVSEDKFSESGDDHSTITGTVRDLDEDKVKLKRSSNGDYETYDYTSGIDYYLDGDKSSYRKVRAEYLEAEDDNDKFYVRVYLDKHGDVEKLYASKKEDDLEGDSDYKKSLDGSIIWIDDRQIRLEDDDGHKEIHDLAYDVTFYLNGKSSSVRDIEKARLDARRDSDELYATLYLNSDGDVIKIKADTKRDSADRKKSGEIKSIDKDGIELKGEDEVDIDRDVRVDLDNERSSISKLEDAVDDRDRTVEATITIKSGEVTYIEAFTTYAEGTLEKVDTDDEEMEIETREGKVTYEYKNSSIKCTGDYDDLRKLFMAFKDEGKDFKVELKFDDGKVDEVHNREI